MTALVDTRALPFRMKVAWFRDILAAPAARRYLWQLYWAGEAYVDLHEDGVFVDRLAEPLRTQLARHLADETRHAEVFRDLMGEAVPHPAAEEEDVGWTLLHHVVPDVCAASREDRPFTDAETARYMGFLHALELRSIGDLCALREAARGRGEDDLVARLDAILADERFHATYSRKAMWALAEDPPATFDRIRRAERRHYRRMLWALLARFEALGARPGHLLGRLRWAAMRLAMRLGLALPLLPIHRRMPGRLT